MLLGVAPVCVDEIQPEACKSSQPTQAEISLIDLIGDSVSLFWRKWTQNMEVASYNEGGGFVLRGECPHCFHAAAFPSVTSVLSENHLKVAAARCQACNGYILGIVRVVARATGGSHYLYEGHYPIGAPNDSVPDEVPKAIRDDFKEALRCHWVKAWKATVLMCRRALQTSCDMEKAEGRDLFNQIDWLAERQRITEPLKQMAHRIRLLGKKGAHGDYSDIDDTVTPKDADDALLFMNHYLDHVYVLPAQLEEPEPKG